MNVKMYAPTGGGSALVHPGQVENMERAGWSRTPPVKRKPKAAKDDSPPAAAKED